MAEYKISGRAKECAASGTPFEEGQIVVSAIYLEDEGFLRRDYAESAFPGPENVFSSWRYTIPVSVEEEHKLDFELASQFLEKLIRHADPAQEGLVYVLTLLLSRKRRVKIVKTAALPEGEMLTVRIRGPEEDVDVSVRAPRMTAEDVDRLQVQVAELFGFAEPEPEPPAEPEPASEEP